MTPLAAMTLAGCLAVLPGADRITAGDLAAAIPGAVAPAPEIPVAWAPAPGVQRVFGIPELRRLGARLGWTVEPDREICVVRPVAPPDPARLLAAMQKSLPAAAIAIIETSRQPVPEGEVEFPESGLRPGTEGSLWIGYVHYAGTRRFALWARVKVTVSVPRVIAARDLHPGETIAADTVEVETRDEFPLLRRWLTSTGDAIGKWPRTTIRAGTALLPAMLEAPKEVLLGDTVTVEVREGAAHLEMEALAEGSGAVGEIIAVRNPTSHRRFLARVEGKGRVSVKP